jgi:hypothetical protein
MKGLQRLHQYLTIYRVLVAYLLTNSFPFSINLENLLPLAVQLQMPALNRADQTVLTDAETPYC